MKKKIFTALLIIAILGLSISYVHASNSNDDIKFQNEIENGLISNVSYSNETYEIDVQGSKIINLLKNTKKLDTLVQSDGYVYENVYFKLTDDATSAKVTYKDNSEKELEIVTLEGIKYAKCPVAMLKKIDNVYYHAFLQGDGLHINRTYKHRGIVTLKNNDNVVKEMTFWADIPEDDNSFTGAYIYMTSDVEEEYNLGGAGWNSTSGNTYSRVMAKGNCYVNVEINKNVGNTIELMPFGTLTYVGSNKNENGYTDYKYQVEVKDKSFMNKKAVLCKLLLPEQNIMHVAEFAFEGDLIQMEESKLEDKETNVKVEGDNIPKGATLEVEKITSGDSYTLISNRLEGRTSKFVSYEITLENSNVAVQPNGKVKVYLPLPDEFNTSKLMVYRIENDNLIEYMVSIEEVNGVKYATFETDHFSKYVLAEVEQKEQKPNEQEDIEKDKGQEKDDTPKTGTLSFVGIVSIAIILSIAGLLIIKKRK